jgi:AmmeMemoRadiSam system protein A/AmmeMemoRadiSam system protein B
MSSSRTNNTSLDVSTSKSTSTHTSTQSYSKDHNKNHSQSNSQNSSQSSGDSNIESSSESNSQDENSPISRYMKSLDLLEYDTLPGKIESPRKNVLPNKNIKNIKKSYKRKSLAKITEKSTVQNSVYTPPYDSVWFETENGLSLEMYIKRLFQIAKESLSCNLNKDTTKAILVPHAGIRYSGICSASAYYELYNRTSHIKRIILLCTNHQPLDNPNAINIISTTYSKIASYRIGKPKLSLDTKAIEKLTPYIQLNNALFEEEHAFFNQLPFLETIAPNALICPLLIGNMLFSTENHYKIKEILQILKQLAQKDGTVVICTSDLAHINGHFEHKIHSYISQNIRKTDSEILQFLYNIVNGVKTRTNKIDELLYLQNSPACGILVMYLFGKLLNAISKDNSRISSDSSDSNSSSSSGNRILDNKNYFNSRVSCYYTSVMRAHINVFNFDKNTLVPILDITDMNTSSVSYAGVVFTTQRNIQTRKMRRIDMICSQYEKIALLGLAKEQLYYKLLSQTLPHTQHSTQKSKSVLRIPDNLIRVISSPVFNLNLGVFTTLYKNGKLRGCIGTLETDNDEITIETNVKRYILDTAFKDNRFPAVELTEFNKLEFSITILYTLKPITLNEYFSSKFVLGRDGILISSGKKQGYFLPNVARDLGYDKQKLLEELCTNKMGSSTKECFRGNDVKLFYNEGIGFISS